MDGSEGTHPPHNRPNPARILGDPDVLASRAFGPVTDIERHRLPLAELVERRPGACRLVEEVFRPVAGCDESEPFVTDETLDGAIHVDVP